MSLDTYERLPVEKRELILSAGLGEFSQKAYKDVSMEAIAKSCGVSKGILFHYFGSKKGFYQYCLSKSLACLTAETEDVQGEDFYGILFSAMSRKLSLCRQHTAEMRMVNMASRDPSGEIARVKAELLRSYRSAVQAESAEILKKAMEVLGPPAPGTERLRFDGLRLYVSAVLNKYLLAYQQTPDRFLADSEKIRAEMKGYLDLMLYGICGKEQL